MTTTTFNVGLKSGIFIALISVAIFGCENHGSDHQNSNFIVSGDTVSLPTDATVRSKIKTIPITQEQYRMELISGGNVKAIPTQEAEIAPPFSGRVTAVHLKLGMKTQPGTELFEMTSPDFIEAQKFFFQAKSEYQNAQLTLKRQQDLKANGVGADRDLEEATTNFELKEKEYQNAVASLKIFNVDISKLVFGQPLIVRSPIAGEVIDNQVVNGHYIKSDDPPHAKVAELNKVWVVGMVKEKDIRFIHELDGAEIQVAAYPDRKIIGKVYHVNEIVDEDTRSVQVLIECENHDHTLKPGMYVTVKFIDTPDNAIFVPAKSVLQYNDKSYVLVQNGQDKYVKRYVETGVTDKGRVQILSGLTAGEVVIGEGAFYLLDAK